MIPDDLRYTKEHEWVRLEDGIATIGITDHAQSELGDITFVDVPEKGKEVKVADNVATIESVKAASDVYSPVSGTIVEVNLDLGDNPEKINSSPYGEGWICKVRITDENEAADLMSPDTYAKHIKVQE